MATSLPLPAGTTPRAALVPPVPDPASANPAAQAPTVPSPPTATTRSTWPAASAALVLASSRELLR